MGEKYYIAHRVTSAAQAPKYNLPLSRHSEMQKQYRKTAELHQRQSCQGEACHTCLSCMYNQEGEAQGKLEGRQASQGVQKGLL
jgi:hypothetical protein